MMDGDAVKELSERLARPVALAVGEGGRLFAPANWQEHRPYVASVAPLTVATLTGLLDCIKADIDAAGRTQTLVHVQDPATVAFCAALEGEATEFRRRVYAVASLAAFGPGFPFGTYLDAERFFIGLQTGFVDTPERAPLLRLVASIRENNVKDTIDTGVAQQVSVQQGVALIGTATVPNPVRLAPYRTFRDVRQPDSLFVLRLRRAPQGDKPEAALFEADGSSWKLDAIQAIAAFLRAALGDGPKVLA